MNKDSAPVRPLVLGLTGDLMLAVRIEAASNAAGYDFVAAETVGAAVEVAARRPPAAVVLDLTAPAFPAQPTMDAFGQSGLAAPVVAFYPHVMRELGQTARALGLALVVPRSRFLTDTPALLRSVVEGRAATIAAEAELEVQEPTAGAGSTTRD